MSALALPIALALPGVASAQAAPPAGAMASSMSPDQVQAAVKSSLKACDLTIKQKLAIKPMVENYQSQTAGADAATKKSAQESLLKNIYGVLTPQQQATFKASMKSQMASAMSSSATH
jgi:Spy/CpxP family protein refolding chaperone